MARNAWPTVFSGDAWSAAQHNTYGRDNDAAYWVYQQAEDLAVGASANSLKRLPKGTNNYILGMSSAGILGYRAIGNLLQSANIIAGQAAEDLFVGASGTSIKKLAVGANNTLFGVNESGVLAYRTLETFLQNASMVSGQAAEDLFLGATGTTIKRLEKGSSLQGLRVNAAGSALEYGFPRLPFCVLKNSAPITISTSETTLTWSAEEFDDYNWHNPSTDSQWITPTTAGWFVASLYYSIAGASGSGQSLWTARLYAPDGMIYHDRHLLNNDASARYKMVTTPPIYLDGSTNAVGWTLQHQDGADRTMDAVSRFSLMRIG